MALATIQRHFSVEDTDLIGTTLSTVSSLDKLLHLLRDRSEHLDLLDLRLTWEDHRTEAYRSRASILANISAFLQQKRRWTSEVYGAKSALAQSQESLGGSDTISEAFRLNNTSRHTFADQITHECAMLSSAIISLRDGHVAASGKVLDEFIDASREPLPDAMLDEQERVKELCERDLASLGRFLQQTNVQWKK